MKVGHEVKIDRNKMSMITWMSGFTLNEMKKNTDSLVNYWYWN